MSGWTIVFLTLLAVAAFVLVVWASEQGLEALHRFYSDTHKDEKVVTKVLLLIPYILLFIWVTVLKIVLFIITIGVIIDTAGNLRNWWHKGK